MLIPHKAKCYKCGTEIYYKMDSKDVGKVPLWFALYIMNEGKFFCDNCDDT